MSNYNIYITDEKPNINIINNRISVIDENKDITILSNERIVVENGQTRIITLGIQGPVGAMGGDGMFSGYAVNDVDDASGTTYVCMSESNNGAWLVKRIVESGSDMDIKYANITNNPLVTTYSAAFAARVSLTYGDIGDIII